MSSGFLKSASIVGLCLFSLSAAAQVQLVKDINTTTAYVGSYPDGYLNINGTFYFSAWDANNGPELWKSDGTLGGTMLIKDICPGTFTSNISRLTNVNGTLYFTATDGSHGEELWKSDGTLAGTVMVKDIYPGSTTSNPGNFILMNSVLYFSATDGVNGYELWRTDGTLAGTYIVKDINPGISNSSPNSLCLYGGDLFFCANEPTNGWELWKSDGTLGGTSLFKDIYVGASGSSPAGLIDVNGTLFFSATEGTNGVELWKSTGSPAGTTLVKDIYTGATSSNPTYLFNYKNTLFFAATTAANGHEFWKSNGTAAGTLLVKDINPGAASSSIMSNFVISTGNILFFSADNGTNGTELWSTDSTVGATTMVKDIYPGITGSWPVYTIDFNGTLLFQADDGTNGKEIWRSNGTLGGTFMIKDIFPGAGNPSNAYSFLSGTSFALFGAQDIGSNMELWRTDGTLGGTVMVKNINVDAADSYISELTAISNSVLFSSNDGVNGYELWSTDASTAGTVLLKDIYAGVNSSVPSSLEVKNDSVFFSASNGGSSVVWKSNGTAVGTVLVGGGTQPNNLTNVNGMLFYTAFSGNGRELWKTNGGSAGTMVRDICSGGGDGFMMPPFELTNMNGTLYCAATNCTNGIEPWKSDGTMGGTVMVKNINPAGDSRPRSFTYMNGLVYFVAQDNNGNELWVSDGSNPGTILLKDIFPGSSSSNPSVEMVVIGNTLYFSANDGVNGTELWKSDGTAIGTVMIKDIYTGSASSSPNYLTNLGGTVYFTASDSLQGVELWKTDGTTLGTVIVKDIFPGEVGSYPLALTNYNDTLFFSASDPVYGQELWVSTGTAQSTVRVSDICPGPSSSNPTQLTVFGNTLLFTANDGTIGTELWKLGMPTTLGTSGVVTDAVCNGGNSGSINLTVAAGTAPYTFLWSNSATTEDLTGLAAGNYSVLVTDSWNWTTTNTFVVNQPTVLTVSVSTQANVTCNGGSNGSISLTVSGATPAYTFLWSNTATTQNISALSAAGYSVLVTDSKGCTTTLSVTVSQPTAVSVLLNKNEDYCGKPNSIAAATSGGNPSYTFLWSTGSTNDSLFNIPEGNYSVTVTDNSGCTDTSSIFLDELVWQPVPICLITVDSTSTKNVLVWEKPVTAGIDRFKIYRNIAATLTYIGFTDYDSLSIFTDTTNGVNPKNTAYEYALGILDSCGVESVKSSTHITIHQATPQFTPPSTFDLSWTDYSGFSFTQYYILRDNNANNNWVKIDSVPYTLANQYTDFGGTHPVPTDSARYIIEAAPVQPCNASVKGPDPMATTIKSTKSNTSEKVTGPTAVAGTHDNTGLVIYPNPNTGNFIISGSKHPVQSIRIYNILGEQVYSMNGISMSQSKILVDVSFLGVGVYQLQAVSVNGTINSKVVISR